MSQAMLMRIIALENRVNALEARLNEAAADNPASVRVVNTPIQGPTDLAPFYMESHGVGWHRVFGPQGEITEKGLRRWEAQAMIDDLNEQFVSQTA